jgi:hypothetical protein
LYIGSMSLVTTNTISLFVGTLLLWTLCAANMEFVAYSLLILPVIFFVFLVAIVFYDTSNSRIKHQYVYKNELESNYSDRSSCPEKCQTGQCCNKIECDCTI